MVLHRMTEFTFCLKEVLDNAIDEFMMGFGKSIEITINEDIVQIRDYGRGIPLGKVLDVASKMNTGAKYDSKVFKKSVGLNGVGIKAVNALSSFFEIKSFREGKVKAISFTEGNLQHDAPGSNRVTSKTAPWFPLFPTRKCLAISGIWRIMWRP